MDWGFVYVLAVLFIGTFVRSAFGFGEALVAVPLLALVLPVELAAPVAVLVSITVAAIVLVQDWRQVHVRSAGWLVLATLAGTPLGLLLLAFVVEAVVKGMLAVVIVGFSSYSLLTRKRARLATDRFAWLFGFGAGILGGAYGMNGPPLVVYGTLRHWTPRHFRATLQGYFLPASIVVMIGYFFSGIWTSEVTRYYLVALPVVVVAIFAGRAFNRRLDERRFLVYVHGGLIVVGVTLLAQAVL